MKRCFVAVMLAASVMTDGFAQTSFDAATRIRLILPSCLQLMSERVFPLDFRWRSFDCAQNLREAQQLGLVGPEFILAQRQVLADLRMCVLFDADDALNNRSTARQARSALNCETVVYRCQALGIPLERVEAEIDAAIAAIR